DFVLYCDPFLFLIASALQSSLSGHPLSGKPWAHLLPMHTNPTRFQELKLVEMEEAPPAAHAIYTEMMQTHGTTFVPTDDRVLGRWPDCLTVVWQDWKQRIQTPAYEAGGGRPALLPRRFPIPSPPSISFRDSCRLSL
ncbi:MAG: hypothetical protein HYU42_07025, partial [Candidatus Rokubacteria bacterium]|nr:hypothetical protein [Candidatus Rokubacteria bacterium]